MRAPHPARRGGWRASQSDTRAASQAFERMHILCGCTVGVVDVCRQSVCAGTQRTGAAARESLRQDRPVGLAAAPASPLSARCCHKKTHASATPSCVVFEYMIVHVTAVALWFISARVRFLIPN